MHAADQPDTQTLGDTLVAAQVHLLGAGSEVAIRDVAADRGYHGAEAMAECADWSVRTYIPEPRRKSKRKWADKAARSPRRLAAAS